MKITISGPPGSGKTTVAKLISDRLGIELVTGGKIFRDQARRMRVSLSDLGVLAEKDERLDRSLDDFLVVRLKEKGDSVVESRLSGWLCFLNKIEAFKVFVNAREDVRIERIRKSMEDRKEESGGDLRSLINQRERSELERYSKYYGIDYSDTSIYNLVVDSSDDGAEKVAEVILSALHIWEGTKRKVD